ncbi:MAG: S1C family serine protease [Treponema sp.]|nr:S1C family serine protease [Treponema sp.]
MKAMEGSVVKKIFFSISRSAAGLPFKALPLLSLSLVLSCLTAEIQEQRLVPHRSTGDVRLDDIRKQLEENPARAIDLIGVYREVYGTGMAVETLLDYENQAVYNLRALQARAVVEERWDDAASLSRSLASLGVKVENTGMEPDFILADAKKKLSQGNDLGAFLAAVQAHELRPLGFDDALLFLERAVAVNQRRTAAFFNTAASATTAGQILQNIPPQLREYAEGSDSVTDMIRGVATVLVDRGIKIERGRGTPDRVLGSAFFVDASGLLITNYHVITSEVDPQYEGYSRMYIRLGDSTSPRFPAKVVGWDKAMDLALIKAEYKPDFVFSIVDRVIPRVGDTVLAIGSPGGLEKTVTSGIVSSLSRRFLQIGDVIQIDAAVNQGNSGGPVVDTSGRLVGIVFAGIEQYQGLNFAVPAERLAAALPAMIKGGKAERPWLGLALSESASGAEIIYTAPNTPAAQHRLGEGDIIRTINGQRVSAPQGLLIPALQDSIFQSRPGELVALETSGPGSNTVKRRVMMSVPRPDLPLSEAAKVDSKERIAAPLFGMILAASQGKSFSSFYEVKKVIRGSIADEAGISDQDPVSIRGFRLLEKDGYALMDIDVKKRRMGFMETSMRLPAWLDSPDTL